MAFNSMTFLVFFPVVLFVYFIIPKKTRYLWLLVSSYFFYACWNPIYLSLIVASTVITYISAVIIDCNRKKYILMRLALIGCIVVNLILLGYFKYTNLLIDTWNRLFCRLGMAPISMIDIILPVGISFYTLQAIGYTIDVYRGNTQVEKNFFRYALFVSFFPQLVAGPIERSGNLLRQIRENTDSTKWDYQRVTSGLIAMLWGFFIKMVIADRAAILVDNVFAHYQRYGCVELVLAICVFSIQIYCDFAGYSMIAIGAARVLGFELMDNFNTPFFAKSVAELWNRWHISLGIWLRDYVYIPLGGNRKGKLRQYINLLITFGVSGLWHGANWTYMVWGLIHGAAQVIEKELKPLVNKINSKCHTKVDSFGYKIMQVAKTFIVFNIALVFFRATSIGMAFDYYSIMLNNVNFISIFNGTIYTLGLDVLEWSILVIAILVLFVVDVLKYKTGKKLEQLLSEQWIVARWIIIFSLICFIVLFGCYGPGFDSANFIYFQF